MRSARQSAQRSASRELALALQVAQSMMQVPCFHHWRLH
jgi:hypothetical protein